MSKKIITEMPPTPPARREISDNPVKLCHEISRLSSARVRGANIEGIMSQHGARLVLSALVIENGASQRRIAEITHLSPPTVSVILRNMQDEGIVELSADTDDKRQMRVTLTDYGREVDRRAIEKIKQTDSLALEGLSEQECDILMSLLNRMRENLLSEQACAAKEKKQ